MSGGGGGGGSGEISWPTYLEEQHEAWLDDLDITEIPGMIAANPFVTASAFNPDVDLGLAWDAVCEFDAFVDALAHETDWESAITKATNVIDTVVIDDTYLDNDVDAFADSLDDDMNTRVLPQFKAGMRDINAVMSSAFVLGEADIYARRTKEVAKYGTDARNKLHLQRNDMILKATERMLVDLIEAGQLEGAVANVSVDAKRIAIVAQKEQVDMDLEIDENDGRWNLEAYVYGQNMLAAISGGTRGGAGSKPSTAASALSGGLSGAAIGAKAGGPMGALVGGIIGVGSALLL